MILKLRIFLIPAFLLSFSLIAQKPILPDFHADPSAHEWDGKYWIYPSTDEPGSTSWNQMRRWQCYSSANLVDWKHEGEIFNLDSIKWADKAAFAPDCMKWNYKYYFFFPAGFNIGVAVSNRPNGPFSDALEKPLIKNREAGVVTFDPCIFIDTDSVPYLYYGGWKTVGVVKLNTDLISRADSIVRLDLKNYEEGIWVHKRKGIYYFSYPAQIKRNGLEKQVLVYCTSKSPLGPFKYQGEFFDNNSRNSHHSIVQFGRKWYLFYHIEGPSPYERRVCVEYLRYDTNGRIKPVSMTSNGIRPIKESIFKTK